MRRPMSAFLAVVLLAATAAPLPACGPVPGPDGGGVTPSGVLATIDTIASVLQVILPAIRPLVLRAVPEGPAKPAVVVSLTAFEAIGSAWLDGHTSWDARGGARCPAYALTGALTGATRDLARALGDAGVGWGPDLDALLTSLGRMLDRLIGSCPEVDGGSLTATGRAGDEIRAELREIERRAQARGVSLVPLARIQALESR